MKNERGITIIALIITIIVVMILAGVSIKSAVGNNGLITKVEKDKDKIEEEINQSEIRRNSILEDMKKESETIKPNNIDKTLLRKRIEEARKINIEEYAYNLPEANDFQKALEKAENILNDINATQQAVNLAENKLLSTMQKLQAAPKLDFSELDALIRYANSINMSNYNQVAIKEFSLQLQRVTSSRNTAKSQEEIDSLKNNLQKAINDLYNSKI